MWFVLREIYYLATGEFTPVEQSPFNECLCPPGFQDALQSPFPYTCQYVCTDMTAPEQCIDQPSGYRSRFYTSPSLHIPEMMFDQDPSTFWVSTLNFNRNTSLQIEMTLPIPKMVIHNLFFLRCSLIWCRSVLTFVFHFMFVETIQKCFECVFHFILGRRHRFRHGKSSRSKENQRYFCSVTEHVDWQCWWM